MQIEPIPQVELGDTHRVRVGDVLNRSIAAADCKDFRFAVAYMRLSGLDRLGASIDALCNRGGHVAGAVGIDDGITSVEAVQSLSEISGDSTLFYTVSGFRFHPKIYIMSGEEQAVVVIGSANLSCDGLFRNVEFATALHFDFRSELDRGVYEFYDGFVRNLLNTANPNVQAISPELIEKVSRLLKKESQIAEPGPALQSRHAKHGTGELGDLFPPMKVPAAPPPFGAAPAIRKKDTEPAAPFPPAVATTAETFIMQLSAFDSHHRTGVKGTPEILIPHPAIPFFPALTQGGRQYPDAIFDVSLNIPSGRERHEYRLWYYETRAVGTRIDEYRLRIDHDTVDLTAAEGGDLLVISKLPEGSDPAYEVTVVGKHEAPFSDLLSLCQFEAQGKKWGFAKV